MTCKQVDTACSITGLLQDVPFCSSLFHFFFRKVAFFESFLGAFCICFGAKVLLIEQKSILCFQKR